MAGLGRAGFQGFRDPATGKVLEQVLEATAEDVDAAVRAANRAYWDHVAEVFGRRCSANKGEQERCHQIADDLVVTLLDVG